MKNNKVYFKHLGLVDYKEAWDYQTDVFNKVIQMKLKNRDSEEKEPTENYIFFCEHPHVFTLGKSGLKENLLINQEILKLKKADYYEINRGGDITYHGPGQLVGYPILDLDNFFTDIHKYLRFLEEGVILTLKEFGIYAGRIDGLTGVWIDYLSQKNPRKICAFGVKASRWVTMHGLALNVNTDLSYFNNIVPCGISDKDVTSMEKELGTKINIKEVEQILLKHLANLFGMQIV